MSSTRCLPIVALVVLATSARAEPPPRRPIAELLSTPEPAWPDVKKWIAAAKVDVKVLAATRADGEKALFALQVTARSPMGAIALESCGLLIDKGWLRVLGAGCKEMPRSIAVWNELDKGPPPVLVVAMDAIGGLYGVDAGGLGGKPGNVHYFAPDSLRWHDLGGPYTSFLVAALSGDLSKSVEDLRWKGWERDVAALGPDQGITIWPPLWTKEGKSGKVSRKAVPMKELVGMMAEMARQLDAEKAGKPVHSK